MKKTKLMTALLLALPLLTVLVTSDPAGVTVFDGETTRYVSWMTLISDSAWGWCAPAAALLNYLLFGLSVLYAVTKKEWTVKSIFGIAFAAACIAALPIVIQGDTKIIPNALGMILMIAESIAANLARKQAEAAKENEPKGKRLEKR